MIDFDWLWVKSLKDDESGLVPKALTEVLVSIIFMTSIWGSCLILLSLFRKFPVHLYQKTWHFLGLPRIFLLPRILGISFLGIKKLGSGTKFPGNLGKSFGKNTWKIPRKADKAG